MSEVILTFQAQLSGVMETVFKAAMFEITRLVEDSFLEEVSRSREQVEALKKRLQWSETRRKDREGGRMMRCAECGKLSNEETGFRNSGPQGKQKERGLKQEKTSEEKWRSCGGVTQDASPADVDAEITPTSATHSEPTDGQKNNLHSKLKEEALQMTPDNSTLTEDWGMGGEDVDAFNTSAHTKSLGNQDLPRCQEDWEGELAQDTELDHENELDDMSGFEYQARYHMGDLTSLERTGYDNQELTMEGMDGLADSSQRLGGGLNYGVPVGSFQTDLAVCEEGDRRTHVSGSLRSRKGDLGEHLESPSGSLHGNADTSDLNCLLINEDGYLQDTSGLYQDGREMTEIGHKRHSLHTGNASHDNLDGLHVGDTFSHALDLNNGLMDHIGDERERLHTCTQCMITFPDKASLKSHMHSHRSGSASSYHCNQCGKTFTQACNLKVHQRIHQGEGLHLCSHCGKGFTSFMDLRKHRCSKAVDKPYCCTLCGNKFSRLWNLKLHRRIHTQEKPHCCPMCDKSFTRADILKVHLRTHTGERPYCCTLCGLSFKRLDHLKSHQRKHGHEVQS
ncbi:zinc finger protein 436 [Chanos chanos]|uniref:Zinc finger protein 436 n=1 Tax=Chanos chanos TaxID=29144 RepID=A0A6J2WJY0_CHACN|nr:zinc finger protein 436-like [Chanos chanos]